MKIKNFLLSGVLGMALAGAVLTGCNKSDSPSTPSVTPPATPDYSATEDENNAATAATDSKNISNAAAQNNTSGYGMVHGIQAIYSTHCTVIDTSSANTDSIIVSFGTAPYTAAVECNDGRWRQGQIVVYWPKVNGQTSIGQAYFNPGSVLTMVFRNYAMGTASNSMIGLSGSCSDTNKGNNALSEQNSSFHANIKLTYTNGQTAQWVANRINTLVQIPAGAGGTYYYETTGSASGTSRTGGNYNLSISNSNPLYYIGQVTSVSCPHFEAGTINLTIPGYTISLNYGSTPGTCPSTAALTVTGSGTTNNYTINLF
jgi:hypothetical protein